MRSSIQDLSVKTLVKVLTELKGGNIGFDPYRDARTNKKEWLLNYILANFDNSAIIAAISKVTEFAEIEESSLPPKKKPETLAEQHAQAIANAQALAKQTTFQRDIFADAKPEKKTPAPDSPEAKLAALQALLSPSIDENKVREICDARAGEYVDNVLSAVNERLNAYDAKVEALKLPVTVYVENKQTGEVKDCGVQHHNFPQLLKACKAREVNGNRMNVWLYGPAGTGKTHAAHEIAKALGLPFQANGTLLTEHSLSGFIDAGGKYHRTAFREIFEHGGIYLGDEYDVWDTKAAMYLQAALANGYTRFPDGMVKRHPDCVIIFGANTVGKGATSEYSTRNKIDDANGNRVVFVHWPLDEALETAISPNPKWTRHVQAFRAKVAERKLKGHMITPRQSIQGAALLEAGLEWHEVETMVLRRGLSDDHWNSVRV